MKKIIPVLFFVVLITVLAWFYKAYKTVPSLVPYENNLVDESGNTVNFSDLKGNYLLVSYFQTWCGSCIQELPGIDALQMKVGRDKLKVLMISDEDMNKILRFKEKYCNTLDYYRSAQPLNDLNIRVFPTTYLLDPNGNVILSKIDYYNWNSDEVIKLIARSNK